MRTFHPLLPISEERRNQGSIAMFSTVRSNRRGHVRAW
jgi:hypothetical protein